MSGHASPLAGDDRVTARLRLASRRARARGPLGRCTRGGALDAGSQDRDDADLTVAEAALSTYDYRAAVDAGRRVRDDAVRRGDTVLAVRARIWLASALVTLDPAAAAVEMDAVLTASEPASRLDAMQLALVQDLRARAALNSGDAAAASRWSSRAIATSGGLTLTNVSTTQVTMRIDVAIAASLRKDDEETRKYLTYTGAGHLKRLDWISEFEGDLPVCGDAGVEPTDVVVVQLLIDAEGAVKSVTPLYTSRPGRVGEAFARAVSSWRWAPDQIKAVEPFWRSSLPFQLSCQNRPRPDTLDSDTLTAVRGWLSSRGVQTSAQEFRSYVAADDARLARDDLAAVPALWGRSVALADGEKAAARLGAVLDAEKAPAAGPRAWARRVGRQQVHAEHRRAVGEVLQEVQVGLLVGPEALLDAVGQEGSRSAPPPSRR